MSSVSKRVAQAERVLGSSMTRGQRQFLAVSFGEAARSGAFSAQVTMTPKGTVRACIYYASPHSPRREPQIDDDLEEPSVAASTFEE